MVEARVKIDYGVDLHARPAALFVQVASKYSSQILIQKEDKEVNAKSVMGVMSLNIAEGDEIIIKVDGKDEIEAMEAMKKLISSGLSNFK